MLGGKADKAQVYGGRGRKVRGVTVFLSRPWKNLFSSRFACREKGGRGPDHVQPGPGPQAGRGQTDGQMCSRVWVTVQLLGAVHPWPLLTAA